MGEINRVFAHIDAFLGAGGKDHHDILAKVIGEAIEGAKRGYLDKDMDDEPLVANIDSAADRLKELETNPPEDPDEMRQAFRDAAVDAMVCRRSVLPLDHPTVPWKKLKPKEALFDDEDQYSFAIYDTMADEIAKLLPELQQIALEASWDEDQ